MNIGTKGIRIAHIAPGEPFGGLQNVVLDLASQQQSTGYDVAIVWTGHSERATSKANDRGLRTYACGGSLIQRVLKARRFLKSVEADVLHLHMAPQWILPLLGASRALVCSHLHVPRFASTSIKERLLESLNDLLIRRSDFVIAISEWTANLWKVAHPQADFHVVFNGIPIPADRKQVRHHDNTERPIVGFASRLAPLKGVEEFVDLVPEIERRVQDVLFLIAGEGSQKEMVERRLAKQISSGAVKVMGHVDDMPNFYKQLDVAIFSAPFEAFGLRLVEPVAYNVPVAAYRTGAGSDEVADQCAGIDLVAYGDKEALADLTVELLKNPEMRNRMGEAGRADLETNFSMAKMSEQVSLIYENALQSRKTN